MKLPENRSRRRRKEKYRIEAGIQRGMLRNVVIALDMSTSLKELDIKPTRYDVSIQCTKEFVKEFLDRNPLCNIGIVQASNSEAAVVSRLSGVTQSHAEGLKKCNPEGCFSLHNVLVLALDQLKDVPSYMTRELLLIQSSLNTTDAKDVAATIARAKKEKLRCSVVSLSSEVYVICLSACFGIGQFEYFIIDNTHFDDTHNRYIFKKLALETNGTYNVCTDKSHFKELMFRHVTPLPSLSSDSIRPGTHFVHMGFPKREFSAFKSLCACHHEFSREGFYCPKCQTKVCNLPTNCPVCGLRLVSSSHLARSYHHLFPVEPFIEATTDNLAVKCASCNASFSSSSRKFSCPNCKKHYCEDCDTFIHESLHNCPGCSV